MIIIENQCRRAQGTLRFLAIKSKSGGEQGEHAERHVREGGKENGRG